MAGDPFGIAQGLANFFGISVDFAGFMLGGVLTICILIMLEWTIGSRASGGQGAAQIMFMSFIFGAVLSRLFGWFPDWSILFILVMAILALTTPFLKGGT